MNSELQDVIVIGAGPTGLACAIEAKKSHLNCLVIEKGCIVNSIQNFPVQMTFFTTPELLEIGGLPFVSSYEKPTRLEALKYYRRTADTYQLKLRLYETVLAVEGRDGARIAGCLDEQGREVKAGGPALSAVVQLVRLLLRHLRTRSPEERPGLRVVQSELAVTNLQEHSRRPELGQWEPVLRTSAEDEVRVAREVLRERLEYVHAVSVGELVDVVEHEHDRLGHRGQRSSEAWNARRPHRIARRCGAHPQSAAGPRKV